MAPVWPGIVRPRRWRSSTVVRLDGERRDLRRLKSFMTHLHASFHTERPACLDEGCPFDAMHIGIAFGQISGKSEAGI
jgi:hypothetical protein